MSSRSLFIAATAVATVTALTASYLYWYRRSNKKSGHHRLYVCVTCSVANRPGAAIPGPEGKPKSGEALHQALLNAFLEREAEWIPLGANCYALLSNPDQTVEICEQRCFGACSRACSVVLTAPHKYGYHVAELEAEEPGDVEDVMGLVGKWVASPDACCLKKGERPGKTATNCISRQPPSLPNGCCGGNCC